ncbi:hypothetical protein F5051DRAFT_400663 [Lentinula edodes]|nr:hypothetical protein F5051DRAFT_400663 [Lentinula edodes]
MKAQYWLCAVTCGLMRLFAGRTTFHQVQSSPMYGDITISNNTCRAAVHPSLPTLASGIQSHSRRRSIGSLRKTRWEYL